jgi:lysophospholipase L1-like esterase
VSSTRRAFAFVRALPLVLAWAVPAAAQVREAPLPTRHQKSIDAFVAQDRFDPPPRESILFIGSSIFRQWKDVVWQMRPLPVFNRAFGGSRTADILHYMDQIVLAYEPRIIVYYCGSNDIKGGEKAQTVAGRYFEFVRRVHARLPATRVFFVSINQAPEKAERRDVVDAANALVHAASASDPRLGFIDVNSVLLDGAGCPRTELFRPDGLHLKDETYELLAAVIKPVLEEAWRVSSQAPRPRPPSPSSGR